MLTSKGIVNSAMITFFELTDQMMRSEHWRVDVISIGKVSCRPTSALMRQSVQPSSNVGLCLFLCRVFTSGSTELCRIQKSHALPNLNSSTSDFVGSFSFIDELCNTTFVQDLGNPNHFFRNFLIKRSIFSILESDNTYLHRPC